jgi:hypothetical protein
MRERLHLRNRPDDGQALIIVLVVSILAIAAIGIAFTTARAGINESIGFKQGTQGEMAAQTGLAYELTAMRNATAYTALPCSLTGSLGVSGAASTYSVAVSYSANGTALSCTGSGSTLGGTTTPTNATLTSTGKARYGSTSIMKQDVSIAQSAGTEQALGYAIFTPNNLDLQNAAVLNTGVGVPNIYAGEQLTCDNGTNSSGSVITYYPATLSNACSFSGSLTANGLVTMENSASVGGDVISYGAGITMTGNASIGGNATATGGNISLSNSAKIAKNAYASGTISVSGGSKITGTQTPNDSSLSSETMPAQVTFPVFSFPSSGWNVVTITSAQCATYFQSINNEASGTSVANPDPFQLALENQTAKTIYEAPTCNVTYSNAQVFAQNATPTGDAILDVASLTFNNSNTFCEESANDSHTCMSAAPSATAPNLILYAGPPPPATCTPSTVDATFNNSSDFEPNVTVLVFTPGEVDYANAPSMTGQILACGGVTGTNAFTLSFNPSAAYDVFGTPGSSVTITTNDKYVVSG